jgi:hypothetical protein
MSFYHYFIIKAEDFTTIYLYKYFLIFKTFLSYFQVQYFSKLFFFQVQI